MKDTEDKVGCNRKKEEYDSGKVEYNVLVNVYRSAPDESNLMEGFPCFTTMLANNTDIRNYLLTNNQIQLKDIPQQELDRVGELELWKKDEHPHRAFYFFDILFGEFDPLNEDIIPEEEDEDSDVMVFEDPAQKILKKLYDDGYVFLRNEMGREWEEYDIKEAEMEEYYSRSQEEIDESDRELSKKFLEIAYLLEKERISASHGIARLLSNLFFQVRKRTVYKDIKPED